MLAFFTIDREVHSNDKKLKSKICLVPIGQVDSEILHYTQKELEKRFSVEINIGKRLKNPDYAYKKKRNQFYSDQILEEIYKLRLLECDRVLGVVDVDLYVPERTFVFGKAHLVKKVAVISLTRLRQEFYGLPEDLDLYKKRVITEAVHEIGHIYGLRHCKNSNCVMFLSNTLGDTDQKGPFFCSDCKKDHKS